MSAEELQLVRPEPKRHAQAICDLKGKCFGYDWNAVRRGPRWLRETNYDWDGSTIGLIDGEVVTHWGVYDYQMRIGSATVRTAGIGGVCTHGWMRKKGLMARTATAGIEVTRRAGYDMTVLFGIHDFYHRFGYVRAWTEQLYIVDAARLPKEPPAGKTRRMLKRDAEACDALYNRSRRGLTGTAVKPARRRQAGKDETALVWPATGQIKGYLICSAHKGRLEHEESAGDPEQILRALGGLARRKGAHELRAWALHPDSALARTLRRGFCRLEHRYAKSGGAMIRTLSLASTLTKMCREFSARLTQSEIAGWKGGLLVADPRERVLLRLSDGKVRAGAVKKGRRSAKPKATIRGGEEIAQLILGTDEPEEVCEAGRIRLSGDARGLARVLFPNRHPMLESRDRY
jgi:predicted N-acetyltransferase YhbS